jgi:hypothetical protein
LKVEHSSGPMALLTSQGDLHLRGVVV